MLKSNPGHSPRRYLWAVAALTLGLLVSRWLYLALWCPYGLVEDEAQYWEWSKHLALSYYTKGPGIAWTIALVTAVLGDTEFAVRAAAPLYGAVMVAAVAWLVVDARQREGLTPTAALRDGLYAAIALAVAPIVLATSMLGTIDGPYCACWALACVSAWRLGFVSSPGGRATLAAAAGLALGAGFLYKYTIVLLVPGLVLFRLLAARHPSPARRRAGMGLILLGTLVGFAAASPVLIWNHQHGWPTVAHLLGHLGFAEGTATALSARASSPREWSPFWILTFVGSQIGLAGPGLGLALIGVVRAFRFRHSCSRVELFLACAGVPILGFYFAVSLFAEPEGNWPMAAYVTLLPLGGLVAARAISRWREDVLAWRALRDPRPKRGFLRRKPETLPQFLWHFSLGIGLVGGVLMLRADLLAHVPGLQGVIPRERLAQGPALAAGVETLRARALESLAGAEPFIVAHHYGRASHLAFYLPDRPIVRCASSALGGRPTPHDYWPSHDLRAPELRGQPALLIGGTLTAWRDWFESIESLGLVPGVERKGVEAFLGRGYKGPPSK